MPGKVCPDAPTAYAGVPVQSDPLAPGVSVELTPSDDLRSGCDAELLRLAQALNEAWAWLAAEIQRLPDDDAYDDAAARLCSEYVVRTDPLVAGLAQVPSGSLAGAAAKMAVLVDGSLSRKRGRSLAVTEHALVDSIARDLRWLMPAAFAVPTEAEARPDSDAAVPAA